MVHAFLLMGQSNMAGRGIVSDAPMIIDDRIKVLKNGRWQRMWEPIHADRRFAGIGPGASFAQAWLKDHPDEEIGLVPLAEGGSALDEWMPGEALFEHAAMQTELVKKVAVIDGILWHQGEADTHEELHPLFEGKTEHVLQAFRDRTGLKDIPIIVGELGDYLIACEIFPEFRNYKTINDQLMHYAQTHENVMLVTSKGLTCNKDIIHFDAASQRLFGARYYEAYKTGKDVTEPLAGEQEVREEILAYQTLSQEEKRAYLEKLGESGALNWQELSFMLSEL